MYYHYPVLLKESVKGLNIKPSGIYVDVTYGGGGHSLEILGNIIDGKLLGIDWDEDAAKNIISDGRFVFIRGNFRFLKNYLRYYKIDTVDGIIADLGVSSRFFDDPDRGFSYKYNKMLDMRMNQNSGFTARDILNKYSAEGLIRIFRDFGEIRNAAYLAEKIIAGRQKILFEKTGQLIKSISGCIPRTRKHQYLSKVFQAIRIEVNSEIDNLKELLTQTIDLIKPHGRLVVISYHSLEDRIVKNFIRWGKFSPDINKDIYGNYSTPFRAVNRKVIVPGQEEIRKNNRAKSAKLRIAERN